MLTFMLLVVLGGGLGLLAVSLAESPKPATDGGNDTRAPDDEADLDAPLDDAADDVSEEPVTTPTEGEPAEPESSFDAELAAVLAGTPPDPPAPSDPPAPLDPPAATTRRPPDPRRVPLAYTAIEGRYDAVAVSPVWRRLLSITALVVIAATIGIAVAAVAAAVFGALSELLNNAVG